MMLDHTVEPAAYGRQHEIACDDTATFTIGLEEEMFLVDAETLDCVSIMPAAFEREAGETLGDAFEREMIASMVELVTGCHQTLGEARSELASLRSSLSEIAGRHGLSVMACGTHPFSAWREQVITEKPHYDEVAQALQLLSVRGHACGLHVHVALPNEAMRIPVMNEVQRYIPLLLALSTSSPFWMGEETGLKSYRTAVNNEIPRSGLPGQFRDADDYALIVRALVESGAIPDESHLWWAIRPSRTYPTLELRICDSCTMLEDAIAIAALYRAIVHHLVVGRPGGLPDAIGRGMQLVEENRWQAARWGLRGRFIDCDTGAAVEIPVALRRVIDEVSGSIETLGMAAEVAHLDTIIARGTSADRQITTYRREIADAKNASDAVRTVAAELVRWTAACGDDQQEEKSP